MVVCTGTNDLNKVKKTIVGAWKIVWEIDLDGNKVASMYCRPPTRCDVEGGETGLSRSEVVSEVFLDESPPPTLRPRPTGATPSPSHTNIHWVAEALRHRRRHLGCDSADFPWAPPPEDIRRVWDQKKRSIFY